MSAGIVAFSLPAVHMVFGLAMAGAILALALAMVFIGYAYSKRRTDEHPDRSVILAVTVATMLAGVAAFVIGLFVP